ATYSEFWLKPFKAAAASFAVEAIAAPIRDMSELESVVAAQAREPNGGLIVMPDSFTDAHRVEITSLVARYRLPAVYAYRFFAVLGGLLSYGPDLTDTTRSNLCRSHPQGGEACRPAGAGANQVPAGHQPQYSQAPQP